jgi:hypothetical protein
MPTVKIEKNTPLYHEIKGKFESKVSTIQELATKYDLSREYLTRYAKAEGWERGAVKEEPEKQKEILQPFIKETVEKVLELQSQQKPPEKTPEKPQLELQKENARENAKQVDELTKAITEQFFQEDKLKEFVLSTGILGMHRIRQLWLTNKQYYKNEEQKVGLQSATNYLRLAEAYDNIASTLGFGMSKGVNIINQNNNNAEAKAETLIYTETQNDKARKLLATVIPKD